MSRLACVVFLLAMLVSCSKDPEAMDGEVASTEFESLSHGMIVLGEKLENPYTTENIREAFANVYPTKSRDEITTSHYYVRFLPAGEGDIELMEALGAELIDHPVDYKIVVDGDYYHDPSVPEDKITWQYAVIPKDFDIPSCIDYELIDECHISEFSPGIRSADGIDWEAVEREAFRITGNEDMLQPHSKASKVNPSGRIMIVDEDANGGKPFGVSGVKVMCNTFVKFSSAYTDRDGYYTIPKKFSAKLRYRLMFKNEKDFAIGFNLILLPASRSTLGKASAEGINVTITKNSDRKLFLRSVVNNAVYDYISRCSEEDLNLTLPPKDLRIWLFGGLEASSAVMIHHKAVVTHRYLDKFLGPFSSILAFFAPDITIGTKNMHSYKDVYRSVTHELAHSSHFAQVGTEYWNNYIEYILKSYFKSGGMTYGNGDVEYAGHCEIGEMWAYYLSSKMYQDRYGGPFPQFGTGYWFNPQIFRYLDDRGFAPSDFLSALKSRVTDTSLLRQSLVELYPSRRNIIEQVFSRYEK